MILAEWVSALDTRLKDAGGALFTADEKEAHIRAAVLEYSRRRPRVFTVEIATEAGRQSYPLPEGCLWVIRATLPAPARRSRLGDEDGKGVRGWLEDAGALWVFPVPERDGLPIRVTGAGAWAPEEVPATEAEAVLIAAHARCCEALASDTARLFSFAVGTTKFEREQTAEQYRALARDLRAQFRCALARL